MPASSSEVTVSMAASPDSPGLTVYRAVIGLKSCDVPATGNSSFDCNIGPLPAGTLHRVQVVACLATGDCSSTSSGEGYTLPDGMAIYIFSCDETCIHVSY